MELFTLTVLSSVDELVDKLYRQLIRELGPLHNEHNGVIITRVSDGRKSDIICTASLPGFSLMEHAEAVYERAAAAFATIILSVLEPEFMRRIISTEFKYNREETEHIMGFCRQLVEQDAGEKEADQPARKRRKRLLERAVKEYLEENTLLVLEGFLRFRVKPYHDELLEIVEYAVDEFLLDKQYQEFISLLKYFVYIQEAKIPVAHLMHKGGNDFILLNEQYQPIETKHVEGFVVELIDKDINDEDMIVSTLITVSPEKVYIHTRTPELQVIHTIKQIFEDRAILCTNCSACQPFLDKQPKQDQLYP